MWKLKPPLALAALLLTVAAHADPAAVIRLSPEEIARVQAEAEQRAEPAATETADSKPRIHGEVGMSIGTGGAREIYGAANMPLGADGQAQISGSDQRWPQQRPVRRNADRR